MLRHPFAIHRFEKGCSFTLYTKDKKHESRKTTKSYTLIITKGFNQIKNSLDDLDI